MHKERPRRGITNKMNLFRNVPIGLGIIVVLAASHGCHGVQGKPIFGILNYKLKLYKCQTNIATRVLLESKRLTMNAHCKRLLKIDDVLNYASVFYDTSCFCYQNKSRLEDNIMSHPNLTIYKKLLR